MEIIDGGFSVVIHPQGQPGLWTHYEQWPFAFIYCSASPKLDTRVRVVIVLVLPDGWSAITYREAIAMHESFMSAEWLQRSVRVGSTQPPKCWQGTARLGGTGNTISQRTVRPQERGAGNTVVPLSREPREWGAAPYGAEGPPGGARRTPRPVRGG